jgi:hypothetical protein
MASATDVDIESQEEEDDDETTLPEAFEAELVEPPQCDCQPCLEILEIGSFIGIVAVCVFTVLFIPITIWHFMAKWFPQSP